MAEKIFVALLIFVPLAAAAYAAHLSATLVFFLAGIAIVPLAKYIGESVEQLSSHTNPALGGFLSATFGNATELIIGIFALRAGLFEVVKASITGSVIGNLLLVLGTAMFFGGLKREKQTFNRTAAQVTGSNLFIGAIALSIPAIFILTAPSISPSITENLSILVAGVLICMYLVGLFFSLHTHKHLYVEGVAEYEPKWGKGRSLLTLFLATIAVAWMSNILVNSITPLVTRLGWSQLFIGVVFIAIIGNAAEHYSAILVALKNRMDLSLQISIGSATQMIMFVAPALALISLFLIQPMNLVFNLFELFVIIVSVFIVNLVIADGESNWFEGVQLFAAYLVMAVAFFFHP